MHSDGRVCWGFWFGFWGGDGIEDDTFGFKWDFVSGLYTWETARDFPSCSTAVRHQSTHDTSLAMFTIHHASRAESVFPVDIKRSSTNMGEHATQALNTHHLPLAA